MLKSLLTTALVLTTLFYLGYGGQIGPDLRFVTALLCLVLLSLVVWVDIRSQRGEIDWGSQRGTIQTGLDTLPKCQRIVVKTWRSLKDFLRS